MANQEAPLPIRITTLGMDDYAQRMLADIFQQRAASEFVLVNSALAEAGIVDLDGFGANERWKLYRANHPHLPAIVLSIRTPKTADGLYVQKPVKINELIAALEGVRRQVYAARQELAALGQRMQALEQSALAQPDPDDSNATPVFRALRCPQEEVVRSKLLESGQLMYYDGGLDEDNGCGHNKVYNHAKPLENMQIYYNPAECLQGVVDSAAKTASAIKTNVKIEGLREWLIVTHATRRTYYSAMQQQLRTLSLITVNPQNVRMIFLSDSELNALLNASPTPIRYQNTTRLMWKLAVWCGRGRLPEGTDIHTPVILKHWPNMTRLLLTPHALQIAALWRKQAFSLLETAHALRIHPCHVFTFYTAAHALDIAILERRQATAAFPPRADANAQHMDLVSLAHQAVVPASPKRSLFQRILGHLRKLT